MRKKVSENLLSLIRFDVGHRRSWVGLKTDLIDSETSTRTVDDTHIHEIHLVHRQGGINSPYRLSSSRQLDEQRMMHDLSRFMTCNGP